MQEVTISEFKMRCIDLINQVSKTGKPIRITRRGKPVAVIVAATKAGKRRKLGTMAGTGRILGDIVSPIIDLNEFEAYRD